MEIAPDLVDDFAGNGEMQVGVGLKAQKIRIFFKSETICHHLAYNAHACDYRDHLASACL